MAVRLSARVGKRIVLMPTALERPVVVGTAGDCDVVLADQTLSRRHLRLSTDEVEDLGSTNGTRVAGARVTKASLTPPCVVLAGDVELRLGFAPLAHFGELETSSPPMAEAIEALRHASGHLLLEAEVGCDELLAARAVHQAFRAGYPLEVLDCRGASGVELFGSKLRTGALERASGGTLVLTDVAALPLVLQPLLWRALERGEVGRSGEVITHRIDTRIIAVTPASLGAEVDAGRFDAELSRTLAQTRVRLPALRERPDDIPAAVQLALGRQGAKTCGFQPSRDTLRALQAFRWPLNGHELAAVVERAVRLTADAGPVDAQVLGLELGTAADERVHETRAPRERVRLELERDFLVFLLARFDGDLDAAARSTEVDRATLFGLVKKHQLQGRDGNAVK